SHTRVKSHVGSAIAKLDLGSAALNYILGYRKQTQTGLTSDLDPGNAIPNCCLVPIQNVIPLTFWSHELRLDSEGKNRFWDYTVGAFKTTAGSNVQSSMPSITFPGAFGDPAKPS